MKTIRKNKEHVVFIFNPVSGHGNNDRIEKTILSGLDFKRFSPVILKTAYKGHGVKIARNAIKSGIKKIVAVGGDGTVNEIASVMLGRKAVLGIIPNGSGNGLARSLKIPLKAEEALRLINNGRKKKIDAGKVNGKFFFCTCGTGFDARVGKIFDSTKKRGLYNYVKTAVREFFAYQPKKYSIRIDGKKLKEKAFLVTIANAPQYGNNAYIAPHARIDDGILDICILRPFPRIKSLLLGLRLFNRTIDRSKYHQVLGGKKIIIQKKKKIWMHLDGEPVRMKNKIKITVLPKALHVIVGDSF